MRKKSTQKEIAILGGAFNPITLGHIQIARTVLSSKIGVHEVWIMPCYTHIYQKDLVDGAHRLAMCRLAISGLDGIKVSDYEFKVKNTLGTYELMRRLKAESNEFNYSMIIGQDNGDTFHHWIDYKALESLIRFIVLPRQGIQKKEGLQWYDKKPHIYLDKKIIEVSSTLVRDKILQGDSDSLKNLIDPRVEEYIVKHKLYLKKSELKKMIHP